MNPITRDRWESRLHAWAEYMLTKEKGGKVKISSAYYLVGKGAPGEGDGVPIDVGEALDTDALYHKLPEHLRRAVWANYVWTGTMTHKAGLLGIPWQTLATRVRSAVQKLEDLHQQRKRQQSKNTTQPKKYA